MDHTHKPMPTCDDKSEDAQFEAQRRLKAPAAIYAGAAIRVVLIEQRAKLSG